MTNNYARLVEDNLERLFSNLPPDFGLQIIASQEGDRFSFTAFGEKCTVSPQGITLGSAAAPPILGILISLYCLHASDEAQIETPLRAFKEFPNSMPYVGAFTSHTEQVLAPHVIQIKSKIPEIIAALNGSEAPVGTSGDFAFLLRPLPKIGLCYIFYEADDDFPASTTCLYTNNSNLFMPMDGLADVGEYTSKKIISLLS
jgi:hypothetical protein